MTRPLDGIQNPTGTYGYLLDRLRAWELYILALSIFAASRIVVYLGVWFGKLLVKIERDGLWDAGPAWYHRLLRWDSGWYASIVNDGYQYTADPSVQNSTAFYPVYPAVTYLLKSALGIDVWIALLLIANLSSVVAVLLLAKFVKDEFGDETALLSVALLSFFPSAVFFSAGYTESLCLALILASFIFMKRENFLVASILAGFALCTRSQAIVLIPIVWWEIAQRNKLPWMLPKLALYTALASSGLIAFMIYLDIKFGEPLAFVISQRAWHAGTLLDRVVAALTLASLSKMYLISSTFLLFFAGVAVWSFRWLRTPVSLYAIGSLLFPYLTVGPNISMNRYLLMCFPVFISLGILCKGRPWLSCTLIGLFAPLLLAFTALFSQWYRLY
jgi:Dolichyl-phosphate-mannose-protein mannosyltransferase